MKKIIFGLSLILLLSVFCLAQKQKKDPNNLEEPIKSNQAKSGSNQTSKNSFLKTGTSFEAQLQKTLDVKDAEVGDSVILKVTKEVRQEGEVVVPKGAKLIGRVTEVQEKTKNSAISKLSVAFDRIEGKNLNAPINATIVSVTQTTVNAAADVFSSDISSNSSSSGSASSGGLLGGVGSAAGSVVNTATNTVGNAANNTGQTLGGATQTVGRAINGIQISQSADASINGSTTLSSQNKNLRLEKGATFRLQLIN